MTDGGTPAPDASEENGHQLTSLLRKTSEERGPAQLEMPPDDTSHPHGSQVKDWLEILKQG